MTRMMLYTFYGPNRTGADEQKHLAEAPWVMTGPLVVLGVLSAVGGWMNLPALLPLGPIGQLEHWLEPVVGESALRVTHGVALEAPHTTEYALIGVALAVAIAGIVTALSRLHPSRLPTKAEAKPEHGVEKVLAKKYYVDEIYDDTIVQPTVRVSRNLLWRGIDVGLIDGVFVNFLGGWVPRTVGWLGSQLQSGQVGTYAWVLVVGVLLVLGAFTVR
jgi:NADH-quinone oxidoreductase subunit L